MATFMADNFTFSSQEEKELLQAYANELYDHYMVALECEQISSQANDIIDKFRNTYLTANRQDKEHITRLVESYVELLDSKTVKENKGVRSKIDGEVGLDLVYLLSFVDMPDLRNKYSTVFRY